jgi:uncharacterized SAM-binding protein YcdF (DUF218 family)
MQEFVSILILPLHFLWLIIITAIVSYAFRKPKITRICSLLAILWLAVITTGILPSLLIKPLEHSYPPLLKVDKPDTTVQVYVMVLGAGHTEDYTLPPNSQLSPKVLGRLIEGIRLYHALPGSILIFSGDKGRQTVSQAITLSQTAGFLGVEKNDIRMLTTTKNTADEAHSFRSTFGTQNKLYVVTDAIHMRRAMFLFTSEGINAFAAPTNFLRKKGIVSSPLESWIPGSENIGQLGEVFHEYIGLWWAKIERLLN